MFEVPWFQLPATLYTRVKTVNIYAEKTNYIHNSGKKAEQYGLCSSTGHSQLIETGADSREKVDVILVLHVIVTIDIYRALQIDSQGKPILYHCLQVPAWNLQRVVKPWPFACVWTVSCTSRVGKHAEQRQINTKTTPGQLI